MGARKVSQTTGMVITDECVSLGMYLALVVRITTSNASASLNLARRELLDGKMI